MESTFEKLLVLLADGGVDFVIVGGIAVTLHGYVRLTEDVDILIARTPENVARLLSCLADYGEGFARELNAADFADEEGAIRIVEETEQAQIDIFTRIRGLRYPDLRADAEEFVVNGRAVRYASKAALIRLKENSMREKDRLDVIALQRLSSQTERDDQPSA
jgi:predicted nucleotidyltransferase